MSFTSSRRIYESLPLRLKRAICLAPFGWIAGRSYRETYSVNDAIEGMARDEIRLLQESRLAETLDYATSKVAAYKPHRKAVERYSAFDALKEFPLITKDDVIENFDDYITDEIREITHYAVTTGGTGGEQFKLLVDDSSQSVDIAYAHRLWKRVGYTPRMRKATFRGVPFPNLKPDVYWQYNPIYNEIQFSPFNMSEQNMFGYVEQLSKFGPQYLHGYASSIDTLSEFVIRNNLRNQLPPITAAFITSEAISRDQRARIESAFRTRVFSFYGHSERLVIAGECELNSTYHQTPDYGILEILDELGQPCDRDGEKGEIVGTGLLSRSMPLIRYKTGDVAVRLDPDCECGRKHERFTDVEGRWNEVLIGSSGEKIGTAALNIHGPIFEKVIRYQYFQARPGICKIRVVVSPKFTDVDKAGIEMAYANKVGESLDIAVEVVDDIPLTVRGKLKTLVSEIDHH